MTWLWQNGHYLDGVPMPNLKDECLCREQDSAVTCAANLQNPFYFILVVFAID
jgi:hypothetical protein